MIKISLVFSLHEPHIKWPQFSLHNIEMDFEMHQNGLRLPNTLLPIIYLVIYNSY